MEYIFVPSKFEKKKQFRSQRHINVTCAYHVNFEMEFIIVKKGTVTIKMQGEEHRIGAGQGFFCMPFEPHSFDTETYSECHILLFPSDIVKNFFEFLVHHTTSSRCFDISKEAVKIVDRILPNDDNIADYVDALACLAPICSEIKHKCDFYENECRYDDIFIHALSEVNENYTSPISLDSVAKQIGVNSATLSRTFAENAKVNFNTYVNSLRCYHAATQITETDNTFTDIAYLSGFGSIRNFNRIFYKHMGCTPSEYKKNPFRILKELV